MKLNTTTQVILMCTLALYLATFMMSTQQGFTKNGLLTTKILGIFMVIVHVSLKV